MTFRDLEYLVAVAEWSHFGRAAEACHVSQSALSLQLQKLEHEVGAQLVERTSRRVVITETGKEVVRRAKELLQGQQELLDAARHFQSGLPERVRIAAIPTIAPYQFARLQGEFQKRFPQVSPLFDEETTERLIAAVVEGDFEVGVLATPCEHPLIEAMPLFEEPFYLAVPARHALAKKKTVSPKDFAGERLLVLKDTHCLRTQVLAFCSANKVVGNENTAAANIATLLALVRSNGGVTLIPDMATGNESNLRGIRCLPVSPAPSRQLQVIFRKTSRVGRRLAEAVAACFS